MLFNKSLALVLSVFAFSTVFSQTYTPPSSPRSLTNLNASWKFHKGDVTNAQNTDFSDAGWDDVTIPHDWNGIDGQDGGGNYYRGIGWYRKHYTISSACEGKQLYLQFDGVNRVADVYVNGTLLTTHKGGYARFRVPVTGKVNIGGDNVIAVKVSNAHLADIPPLSADFTFFGGIYRDVNILVTDKLQISVMDYSGPGVYLKQSNVSKTSASVQISAKVFNNNSTSKDVSARAIIVDHAGTIVKEVSATQTIAANTSFYFVQSTTISTPHLWNGKEDPYLYSTFVEIKDGATVTDLVQEPLGLRYFSLDANTGFHLNGAYLDLHGVNMHQDYKDKGYSISTRETDTSLALVKELGTNFLRLPHYQHSQYTYNRCDSMGIVVWAELALVNYITESAAFYDNSKEQLKELIRQNYNHPSIIFWSVFNEITLAAGPSPAQLISQLATLAKTEDSTRLTTAGSCAGDGDAVNWFTESIAFNKYFGWYSGTANQFGPWADAIHNNYPDGKVGISEYGVGANTFHHEDNPAQPVTTGQWHPEEYQNLWHESQWKQMLTRPYLWCKLIWNMFDFAVDSRNEGSLPGLNDKGLVTYDRAVKKDCFYWYKANWSSEPFAYITSRRFTPRETSVVTVKAYSNCQTVELFVNGQSLGSKTSTDHIFTWQDIDIPNKDNLIKVVGTQDGKPYADSTVWGYFGCNDQTLSKGRAVTSSSSQTGNEAANAVDENEATRWSASDGTFPQWWMVDLGESKDIGSVRIAWYKGTDHRQYRYKIEVSDNSGSGFTTAADRTDNAVNGVTQDMLNTKGRYVRVTVTGVIPAGGWAGFFDVKIYAPDVVSTMPAAHDNLGGLLRISGTAQGINVALPFKGAYTATLYDLKGRQMLQKSGTAPSVLKLKRNWYSGTYILSVKSGGQAVVRKIVLK
jgi:beta-galactosidase